MKLLLIIVNLQAKLERFGKKLDQKNFFNFFFSYSVDVH